MQKYNERWERVKQLDSGQQGYTYLVKNRETGSQAVLKLLREDRANDLKARTRMAQEALNLDIVANNGGKVPRVIENHTGQYENSVEELYFVMEYISGQSLKQLMRSHEKISPSISLGIAIELCRTVAIGHNNNVLHRDIKPANLIVRSLEPADVWIVDYGISFNDSNTVPDDLTDTGERIGNNFTDFPERHTPGAKRLPHSDTGAICAVLFHCLTGLPPTPLRDAHGNPPHRQHGRELNKIWPNQLDLANIIGVLDQGFQHNPLERFASAEELMSKLTGTSRLSLTELTSIEALFDDESHKLRLQSRQILLGSTRDRVVGARQKLDRRILHRGNVIGEFVIEAIELEAVSNLGVSVDYSLPDGFESLSCGSVYQLTLRRVPKASYLAVIPAVNGNTLNVFGGRSKNSTPLLGQGAQMHHISTQAPFAFGGFGGSGSGAQRPKPPSISFADLNCWMSNGIDYDPDEELLFQLVLNEIAQACRALREEIRDKSQ